MMKFVRIENLNDTLVIHFGTPKNSINAYTLASTLVAFADSIKTINSRVNPGYEVEIIVDTLESGSFKVIIKTIFTNLNNIFSKQDLKTIVLTILTTLMIEKCISPEKPLNINVTENHVVLEVEGKQIIIPKNEYEEAEKIKQDAQVNKNISKVFENIDKDSNIEYLEITDDNETNKLNINIPKQDFVNGYDLTEEIDDAQKIKIVPEYAELYIYRAYLEKNKKKWLFNWRGNQISAPILDDSFFNKFLSHIIELGIGDKLKVKLNIYQKKHENSNIYINYKYEVEEVIEYIKKSDPKELFD